MVVLVLLNKSVYFMYYAGYVGRSKQRVTNVIPVERWKIKNRLSGINWIDLKSYAFDKLGAIKIQRFMNKHFTLSKRDTSCAGMPSVINKINIIRPLRACLFK